MTHVVHPFEPVFDAHSRILILGSLPSIKSREQMFFYGHPQNRFWPMLATVLGTVLVHVALDNISKFLKEGLLKDRFNLENESFEQTQQLIENKYSVNIPMRYYYKGRFSGKQVGLFSRV